MISLTSFKSLFDNKTDKRLEFKSFPDFEKALYALSKKECETKKKAFLISPATFIKGTTRANKSVVEWGGWAAVDVDDHEFKGDLKNELYSRFGRWYYICYSTASSTVARPKFRLIFPLNAVVSNEKIRHFWFALNSELGSIGDKHFAPNGNTTIEQVTQQVSLTDYQMNGKNKSLNIESPN